MPSIPVVTSHSSSLTNPCPSGTGIGYMTLNNTIFVICDAAFNFENQVNVPLALGLSLGLGIPTLTIIGCLFYKLYRVTHYPEYRGGNNNYPTPTVTLPPVSPREYVQSKLSEEAYNDFHLGILSDTLKKELIHLRMSEGRDLVECIRYAENIHQADLAHFIAQLNPTQLVADNMV